MGCAGCGKKDKVAQTLIHIKIMTARQSPEAACASEKQYTSYVCDVDANQIGLNSWKIVAAIRISSQE